MEQFYTIVLTFSAIFASFVFMQLRNRLAPLFHVEQKPLGALIALPIVSFLLVAAVPVPVVFAALLLILLGNRADVPALSFRACAVGLTICVAIGTGGLHGLDSLGTKLPALALDLAAFALWLAITAGAALAPRSMAASSLVFLLALLPLAAAPLFSTADESPAIDVAILAGGLLGGLLALRPNHQAGLALRWPLAFLLGFVMLHTLAMGGWLFALISLALWGGGLMWHFTTAQTTERHAFDF